MQQLRPDRRGSHEPAPPRGGACGFSLIELLIVMAVVALLASVAMPVYQDQVRRGHRATAQSAMLDVAARQRQFMLDRRVYATSFAELGIAAPAAVAGRYTITFEAPADAVPPTFRIVGTPTGAQYGDRCGTIAIDQAGTRTPAGCW